MNEIDLGIDGWLQDVSAKSLAWYPNVFPAQVSQELLNRLEEKSIKFKSNTRVCLHKNSGAAIHEMIICQRKDRAHPPKRHLKRDKTFMVLRGTLLVSTFDETGDVLKSWTLEPESKINPFCIRIPAGIFHCDFAFSRTAIHLETTEGPFNPAEDREVSVGRKPEKLANWSTMRKIIEKSL